MRKKLLLLLLEINSINYFLLHAFYTFKIHTLTMFHSSYFHLLIFFLPVWSRATSYRTTKAWWIDRRWRRAGILKRWSASRWRRCVCTITGSGRIAVKIRREAAGCAWAAGSGHRIRRARNIQARGIRAKAMIAMAL